MNHTLAISLLWITLLISSPLHSQADTTSFSFTKSSQAFQFQISGIFQLSSFQGGLISYRKYISNKKAWRVGISLSGSHDDTREVIESYPVDTTRYSQTYNSSTAGIHLFFSYQHYPNPNQTIKFYYGYGLTAGLEHRRRVYTYSYDNSQFDTWSIGPLGYTGVEWFPNKNFSFSGEFSSIATFSYTTGVTYTSSPPRSKITTTGYSYNIYQENVKLGLSVYF